MDERYMDERHLAAESLDERLPAADMVTLFSNGAIMNGDYTNLNKPNIIEI